TGHTLGHDQIKIEDRPSRTWKNIRYEQGFGPYFKSIVMKEKINKFLDYDLLEKYLLGQTTKEEAQQTERYIAMYPEVREAYGQLQANLEAFAKMYSRPTPEGLKEIIARSAKKEKKTLVRFYKYAVAACVAIAFFAGSSYFFWNQNQS